MRRQTVTMRLFARVTRTLVKAERDTGRRALRRRARASHLRAAATLSERDSGRQTQDLSAVLCAVARDNSFAIRRSDRLGWGVRNVHSKAVDAAHGPRTVRRIQGFGPSKALRHSCPKGVKR